MVSTPDRCTALGGAPEAWATPRPGATPSRFPPCTASQEGPQGGCCHLSLSWEDGDGNPTGGAGSLWGWAVLGPSVAGTWGQ